MSGATLEIIRRGQYHGVLRNLAILVDGEKVGEVASGKSVQIPIAPGAHDIQTRIDWITSKPLHVEAAPGAAKPVYVDLCSSWLALFALLGAMPYMRLTETPPR